MQIEGDGFCVRSWQRSDRESLVRHANNARIAASMRDRFPHPYTLADADEWLEFATTSQPETSFAIAVDHNGVEDIAVGGIGFVPGHDVERFSAEIGYWLGEDYWGKGIITKALIATTAWARSQFGFNRVFALPFVHNLASCRVLEKAGFVQEGVLKSGAVKAGRVIDQVLYAHVDTSWQMPNC